MSLSREYPLNELPVVSLRCHRATRQVNSDFNEKLQTQLREWDGEACLWEMYEWLQDLAQSIDATPKGQSAGPVVPQEEVFVREFLYAL